jgi:hypothetical protein
MDFSELEIAQLKQLQYLAWKVRLDSSPSGDRLLNASDELLMNLSLGARIKVMVL